MRRLQQQQQQFSFLLTVNQIKVMEAAGSSQIIITTVVLIKADGYTLIFSEKF